MCLSATVTPKIESALTTTFLKNPVVEKDSINRKNITLEVMPCNFRRNGSSQQSVSLESRDFNDFADKIQEIMIDLDKCAIVYTDFACHVPPIVLALRDRGIDAVGYYGKMKESEKTDALMRWRSEEVNVIVATRAFGLGINKPNVCFVFRNGMPPSISAWAQEWGRAGRDGQPARGIILYNDSDIHHVGYWAKDMAKQQRPTDIDSAATEFSNTLPFIYSHLTGKCRRTALLSFFGEAVDKPEYMNYCCYVCNRGNLNKEEKHSEIQIVIKAIDELGNKGEAQIAEWTHGGQVAWMKSVNVDRTSERSAYGCSPPGLSKQWWRHFIRQIAAAGYIKRMIKTGKFDCMYGVYASLKVTEKGRSLKKDENILLPSLSQFENFSAVQCHSGGGNASASLKKKQKFGKGCNMLQIVKTIMSEKEIKCKKDYHYPSISENEQGNVLYYCPDIQKLPHFTEKNPHFLWQDIQFSKGSSNKDRLINVNIDEKEELSISTL